MAKQPRPNRLTSERILSTNHRGALPPKYCHFASIAGVPVYKLSNGHWRFVSWSKRVNFTTLRPELVTLADLLPDYFTGSHTPANDQIGTRNGLPVFLCQQIKTRLWVFKCTCGQSHEHAAREGLRKAKCSKHPGGYVLVPPIGWI